MPLSDDETHALLAELDDVARGIGLYLTNAQAHSPDPRTFPPGAPLPPSGVLAVFQIGDLAFAERTQDPTARQAEMEALEMRRIDTDLDARQARRLLDDFDLDSDD